ncbi:hypothetical protein FACS189454_07590 [Planctomycetales bacterium]|nr:hypothetical protein FACS189454_07590 [Planctomycetales bacterium]
MKTQKNGFLASAFANLLCKHRLPELENAPTDMIVPVPMFWRQRLTRGVNPAELLANELGKLLNKPVEHIVKKNRETLTQHFLSAKDRIENVRDAFSVRQTHQTGWLPNCWSRWLRPNIDIRGKNILLVDDVITTGSTCNEVSCVLLKNGVKSVVAVAVARTA